MTLEEAIAQTINLGEKDPLTIARKIMKRHDKHWLANELTALAEEIISERARHALGIRRQAVESRAPRPNLASREILLVAKWTPDGGWKKIADLTATDCRAVAAHYRMLASASSRRAELFEAFAEAIEAEGVETLGEVQAELPQLLPAAEAAA